MLPHHLAYVAISRLAAAHLANAEAADCVSQREPRPSSTCARGSTSFERAEIVAALDAPLSP